MSYCLLCVYIYIICIYICISYNRTQVLAEVRLLEHGPDLGFVPRVPFVRQPLGYLQSTIGLPREQTVQSAFRGRFGDRLSRLLHSLTGSNLSCFAGGLHSGWHFSFFAGRLLRGGHFSFFAGRVATGGLPSGGHWSFVAELQLVSEEALLRIRRRQQSLIPETMQVLEMR